MSDYFKKYQSNSCCLCGSKESLTGEHKIKASALKKIFNKDPMVIGAFDGESTPRIAQGPKSQEFHFTAKICAQCNGVLTQPADRAFDQFHSLVSQYIANGLNIDDIFQLPQYDINSESYLNVFRYFAKILCCQIAVSNGPRFIDVCNFAIGASNINLILLGIDIDPFYQTLYDNHNITQFAGHGGLQVIINEYSELRSSITLESIRYTFYIRFNENIKNELYTNHYDFLMKCKNAYKNIISKTAP